MMRSALARIAASTARLLPEGLLLRLLPRDLRWEPGRDAVAVAPGSAVALFIGPTNSAGQGFQWARAVERAYAGASAVSLGTVPRRARGTAFAADVHVPIAETMLSRRWQRAQGAQLTGGFTHALIESGRHPFRGGRLTLRGMRSLARAGVSTAFLWHGSDIRLPSAHVRAESDSPFGVKGAYPPAQRTRLERQAAANLKLVAQCRAPVFVSTPGMLDVPRAVWLPVVIDPQVWRSTDAPLRRGRPVVAYAPSNAALKGGPSIDAQLRVLEAEGLITYRRVQSVPAADIPELYRCADIVLDQFLLGDYGVAACEAMAAGRVVIGHVSERVRDHVRWSTGIELPIVESRLTDVGSTVRVVIQDPAAAREMAAAGPIFVDAIHSGRASADALGGFLGFSPHTER